MGKTISGTPFSEYREEQVSLNVFDYFVTPSFFDQFHDTKPLLIYGSRGSGKTTLFKALAISEAKNVEKYLTDYNYVGIYYRIDLNIMASFCGEGISDEQWSKLFSHYFVSALSYELIRRIIEIRNNLQFVNETSFSKKYSKLFSGKDSANSLHELKDIIYDELYLIRDYINNCASQQYPHIGDYATIIKDLPCDLLHSVINYNFSNKIIFYLIDEFEGLKDWQQRFILSLVKYSDDKHTFKICMRPDGLKSAETVGGEYISETDDIKSIDLNEMLSGRNFYQYALDVCKKRIELFYNKNNLSVSDVEFEELFEEITFDQEVELLLKNRDIQDEITKFLDDIGYNIPSVNAYLQKNCFDFFIFKIMYQKNKSKNPLENIWECIDTKNEQYNTFLHNYKNALLYYLYLSSSKSKIYSGFKALVDISGGTLRYLLEICNEIFESAINSEKFSYENPQKISYKTQSNAIYEISKKRVKQISAIPDVGLNIRTFIIALGKICRAYHLEDRISKIEPNHFSIKSNNGKIEENVSIFLKECVMRGVLIKRNNNKAKNADYIGADEYLYVLHPIYTPTFKISWRRKQKLEFNIDEINVLISNDTKKITELIREYMNTVKIQVDDTQLKLSFDEGN